MWKWKAVCFALEEKREAGGAGGGHEKRRRAGLVSQWRGDVVQVKRGSSASESGQNEHLFGYYGEKWRG